MKKIICAALLLVSICAKAGSCVANGTGDWETPGTWSCGHVPGTGDDVTIGAGITVTVNANNTANIGNLYIFGTLQFTNGAKVNLASASVVDMYSGGSITGGNSGAKLVFPSASYAGPFSTPGPYYFSNGGSGTGVLSLTLASFSYSQQNQAVILYWKTENEENINSFEVESSTNPNSEWQVLGTIPSMANGYSYTFIDHTEMTGNRYYRIKIFDKDGKYAYSQVLFITSDEAKAFSVTPTLVNSSMNVTLPTSGPAQVSIFNISGQLVKTLITGTESFNIDVSNLKRSEYFLNASQGKNSYTAKFFKQ
jgi:hypothetical protein